MLQYKTIMLDKLKALRQNKEGKTKGSQDSQKCLIALDIGTEYVKALVGRVHEDDKIEIIGVGRAHQELTDMQAGAISDIGRVVANCDQALAEAEDMAGVNNVRTTTIGIAGELVKGTTTTVRVSRKDHEKEMDMEEVERIVGLVQERALDRAKKQLSTELGGKDVEIRLVNSALVGIEIDDYQVSNPVGFKGKTVTVRLYTAFAPMIHIGAIERVAKELDLELLAVAAEPFAVARSVIGNDPSGNMNAILMDTGGGTTDIAVLQDGGVQGTSMFGIGGRAFTKSIAKDLSIDFAQAEELKTHITSSAMSAMKKSTIQKSLQKTLNVWLGGVELALESFPVDDHLPHRMLLCGGGSSLEMLMDQLEQSHWYKQLPFAKKPSVQHISPDQVVGIVDRTGKVNDHTYITAMGLLRVGLDTMFTQDQSRTQAGLKERINRILSV